MTRVSLLAAAFLAAASPAAMANHGPGRDSSAIVTAGTVTIVLPVPQFTRVYERVVNVGTSGVAWCSRVDNHPAANKAGSFPAGTVWWTASAARRARSSWIDSIPT